MGMMPIPALDSQTLPVPATRHLLGAIQTPQRWLCWERESGGAARRGAHRPGAWLSTTRPWGATAWGERPWQDQGWGMHCPKKFSTQYSTLIRPDLQKNGIPGESRGPTAWLNPLPLCREPQLGMGLGAGGWHWMGMERGPQWP